MTIFLKSFAFVTMTFRNDSQPIAIIGMGCVLPNSKNVDAFWQLLRSGDRTAQGLPPADRWDWTLYNDDTNSEPDKGYSPLGGYIRSDTFNPEALNLDPAFVDSCGWMERWLIQSISECSNRIKSRGLRELAFVGGSMDGTHGQIETVLAFTSMMERALLNLGKAIPDDLRDRCQQAIAATYPGEKEATRTISGQARFAIRLILGNDVPCQVLDAACASSLFAVEHGVRALRDGSTDLAWCGGFFKWGPIGQVLFSRLGGLTRTACTPFDKSADGTIFGDGAGMIALKRLDDAERDEENILGVVRGIGTASDGRGKAAYAPNRRGQVLAMQRAFTDANLEPKDIDYVIAHATGTPVGDATEYGSLVEVYGGEGGRGAREVFLGSNKGNFGHLGWTAGVASVIHALLVLREKEIPPQAGFKESQGGIKLDNGPFHIPKEVFKVVQTQSKPLRIAVSGFGFGGTNAHVLLEEYCSSQSYPRVGQRVMNSPKCQNFSVVAWSAMLPGALGKDFLEAKAGVSASGRFAECPRIEGNRFRMPPPTQRLSDPAQLLLLQATDDLLKQLPQDILEQIRSHTGVFIASTGAGQMWVSHTMRIQRDLMRSNLDTDPLLKPALEKVIEEALTRFPKSGEDSFPGLMPNLLAGRIANIFDLHGINEVIDADARSFLSALGIACRSLSQQDLTLALVGGCTPIAMDSIAPGLTSGNEGVGIIGLMRSEMAAELGLPVIAQMRLIDTPPDPLDTAWSRGSSIDTIGDLPNLAGLPEILDALARRSETVFSRGNEGFQLGPTAQTSDRIRRPDPCQSFQSHWAPISLPSDGSDPTPTLRTIDITRDQALEITSNDEIIHIAIDSLQLNTAILIESWLDQLNQFTSDILKRGICPSFVFEVNHGLVSSGESALTGALQSWLYSYSKEEPNARLLLLASKTDKLPDSAALTWWNRTSFQPVVVAWDIEKGWLSRSLMESLLSPSASSNPLGKDAVVLVLGGSSGLGFVTARQLARRHGATVILVGRGAIDSDEWYPEPLPSEGVFLQMRMSQNPGKVDVRKWRRQYRSLLAQREKYIRLTDFAHERLRWCYEQCDVTNPAHVKELVAKVNSQFGNIDAVIYSVIDSDLNLNLLKNYEPDEFLRMWKSKTQGLTNILEALHDHPPLLVTNASSISTLGIKGLVNYSAANGFQGELLSDWSSKTGSRTLNICWPGWGESGISNRIDPTQKNAVSDTTFLSDLQGAELVDRLISDASQNGSVWLLGNGEKKQFATQLNSFYQVNWQTGPENLPFVDEVSYQGKTVWAKCNFSRERDSWLDGHLIGSDPVVPGTGLLELVAEAVTIAAPSFRITAITDVNFRRFVKLSNSKPITLYVVSSQSVQSKNIYQVDIYSDLLDPNGKVLQSYRHHLSATVEVCSLETKPSQFEANWPEIQPAKWFGVCEPYLNGAAGITLGGVFDTLVDIKTSATSAQGTYGCHLGAEVGRLSNGILPLVLLDGALRLAALCPDEAGEIPVFAPVYLGRLNLYQTGGDTHWSTVADPPIARYVFPRNGRAGTLEVKDSEGRKIISVEGLEGHLLGTQPWISPANLQLPPLVRSVLRRSAESIEVSVPIDPQEVPHLLTSAQLNNQTVLPGSWQMTIAAEVAGMLRPGWRIAAITDQSFTSALKLKAGKESPLRVKAKILLDTENSSQIRCELISDVVHPNGTILQSDRLHGTLNVLLEASRNLNSITPLSFNPDTATAQPWIPEILYWRHSHLRLGQGFSAICDTRHDGNVSQCRYRNPASLPELLGQLRLPPLLLDAMLQPALPQKGRIVGTGIPKRIGAVRFADNFNEHDIRNNWGELLIRSQGDTDSETPIQISVSTPDGSLGLIQVEDFETYSLGAIDVPSGLPLKNNSTEALNSLIKDHPDYAIPGRIRRVWAPAVIRTQELRRPQAGDRVARIAVGASSFQLLSSFDIRVLSTDSHDLEVLTSQLDAGLDRLEIHLDGQSVATYDRDNTWSEFAEILTALHHLSTLFLNRPGLLLQVVVHQADATSSLAYAVMGWCRSLAKDFAELERDLCRCWLIEGLTPSLVLAKLERDALIRVPKSDAVQWHTSLGVRVAHLIHEQVILAEKLPIAREATVLITGGTGGIGLAVADALHRRYGCRLILIGRTEPAAADAILPERETYLSDWQKNSGGQTIATAVDSYKRIERGFKIRDSLAELEARGAQVQAFAVELTNADSVEMMVKYILSRYGSVDGVFHFAGIENSGDTASKTRATFQKVLEAKVASSLTLYQTLRKSNSIPAIWVHGSSIMATFGTPGATDYGAANAWLEAFHHHLLVEHPACRSLLIEWTAWGGTGMLATRPELWDRIRLSTGQRIGPEMGARLLINELESLESGPSPILIVHSLPVELNFEPERRAIGEVSKPLFLDQIQPLGDRGWEGLCHLTPERHRQLAAHTTDGIPSLPGSFELALAVDLLREVLPSWKLAELRNVDYIRFVKVPLNSILPVRVRARIIQATNNEVRLSLELISDFVHRSGRIIDRDRVHWKAEAVLRIQLPAPPFEADSDMLHPSPPLRNVPPAHYNIAASIAYSDDVRALDHRLVDIHGHAWGHALLSGWEVRHPILPTLIGADAMALTPCIGEADHPIVHVNNRTEAIYFFSTVERVGTSGFLKTHCWPAESLDDGNYRCPRLEVRNQDNELVVLAVNALFLAYESSTAISNSAAFVINQVGT